MVDWFSTELRAHKWQASSGSDTHCMLCGQTPALHAHFNAFIIEYHYPKGSLVRSLLDLREALNDLGEAILESLPKPLKKFFEMARGKS